MLLCWHANAGQTFESCAIRRWLSAHSTCPATNKRLSSKQLMSNYALKNIIDTWARDHGVRLVDPDHNRAASVSTVCPHIIVDIPAAAVEAAGADSSSRDDLHSSADQETGSQAKPAAAAAAAVPNAAAAAAAAAAGGSKADNSSDSSRQISKHTGPVQDTVGSFKLPPFSDSEGQRKHPKRPLLQCTRTKWAVTLIVLAVLVAGGVGGGIAAVRLRKPKAGSDTGTGSDPSTRGGYHSAMHCNPCYAVATPAGGLDSCSGILTATVSIRACVNSPAVATIFEQLTKIGACTVSLLLPFLCSI